MTDDREHAALADRRLRAAGPGLELAALLRLRPRPARPGVRVRPGGFLVRPYLQLGDRRRGHRPAACGCSGRPRTSTRPGRSSTGRGPEAAWRPAERRRGAGWRCRVCRRTGCIGRSLKGLEPGGALPYRVRRGARSSSRPEARAPKAAGQPYRFAVFGDCGAGTAEEKAVAYQTYRARPDFVLIAGDIVYTRGRIREYREKFWPVYDADVASPAAGAPLLRSTLFVAAPGNHDIAAPRPGEVPRRPGLFLLLGPAAQRPDRPGGRAARPAPARARGEPGGVPPRPPGRPIPAWRTSRSTTATPTGRSSTPIPTSTGPTRTSAAGSSATWPPPGTPPGGSSPSTTRRSTRRTGPLQRPADARAGRRLRGGPG